MLAVPGALLSSLTARVPRWWASSILC